MIEGRIPAPHKVSENEQQVHGLYHWALASPPLYVAIAFLFMFSGWIDTTIGAPHLYDRPWLRIAFACTGAILLALVTAGRFMRRRHVMQMRSEPAAAADRWRLDSYIMMGLADALGLLGLVYFALSGRQWAVIAGGVLAYVAYWIARPDPRDLNPIR